MSESILSKPAPRRARRVLRFVAATGVLMSALGCTAVVSDPQLVAEAPSGVAATAAAGDYAATLAAIAERFERDFGFPRVAVTLHVYQTARQFERGLVEAGYSRALARRTASSFHAIGGARSVMVNGALLAALPGDERVRLLAHELAHSVQYRLTVGVRGSSEQWLREGFAEYVACRTASGLGLRRFDDWRGSVLAPLAALPPGTRPAPLARLRSFPQWVAAQRQFDVPLYAQAFAAAELLIEDAGVSAMARYFSLTPPGADADRAFADAFAVDLDAFERRFERRWQRLLGERGAPLAAASVGGRSGRDDR